MPREIRGRVRYTVDPIFISTPHRRRAVDQHNIAVTSDCKTINDVCHKVQRPAVSWGWLKTNSSDSSLRCKFISPIHVIKWSIVQRADALFCAKFYGIAPNLNATADCKCSALNQTNGFFERPYYNIIFSFPIDTLVLLSVNYARRLSLPKNVNKACIKCR
jgi:hypothetical protein